MGNGMRYASAISFFWMIFVIYLFKSNTIALFAQVNCPHGQVLGAWKTECLLCVLVVYLQWDTWMASSHCEKRDRLEPHVRCTPGSLGYWHALHRDIRIRISCCCRCCCCFMLMDVLDHAIHRGIVSSRREALMFNLCQHLMYETLSGIRIKKSMCRVRAESHLWSKWHRRGPLYRMLQKAGKKMSK